MYDDIQSIARKLVEAAVAAGADFADARVLETRSQDLELKNGKVAALDDAENVGFGLRVLAGGNWGFASSPLLTRAELSRAAHLAVRTARAGGQVAPGEVAMVGEAAVQEIWTTPIVRDPFDLPMEEKWGRLRAVDRVLTADKRVVEASTSMDFQRVRKWYASSEGADIFQVLFRGGAGYSATAVEGGVVVTRSYPSSHGGQHLSGGWEVIAALPLEAEAERVREEALELLSAPVLPPGTRDVVLGGSQLCLQIHESVGHATELDRALGMEASYAGTSFATPEKLGEFQYASEQVTLMADSTVPGGLATFGFDDEGVRAQRWPIIERGRLVGYATNREVAGHVGHGRSCGCCRADGYRNIPIIRIPNLSLMPGSWRLDDLLADTEGGIWLDTNKSWSIDQRRLNFQFETEIAREIRGGKLGRAYRSATYQGITPAFWRSCDAVCGPEHWTLWGVVNCGKGEPGQSGAMSHGAAPARFRNVTVGVGN